jgi:hypothetical protein
MCDRNQNGGELNPHINLDELTLEDCKKIFSPTFIAQLDTMYMCGNLGDPIVAKDTLEVFRYFREHNSNMWLSMNTNAGARDIAWWTELAHVFNNKGTVIFSVDGLEDTNHLYRQRVKWSIVENSIKSFIAAGGRARWDFLIFEHNQHQVEQAEQLSKTWGFEKFVAKKTGRFVTATVAPKSVEVNGVLVSREIYDRILGVFIEYSSGVGLRKLVQAIDSEISDEDKDNYFDKYPNATKIEVREFIKEQSGNYTFNLTPIVKSQDKLLEKHEPEIWSLVYGSVCIT